MNVLIITEEDVFFVYEFFRQFYPLAASAPYTVSAVTVLAPFNKRSSVDLARQMYGFYGPCGFVKMGCAYVFRKRTGRTVRSLTEKNGIELIDTISVNSSDYIARIRALDIDVIVSIAAPQVFRGELINSATHGCVNSHSSLLPENRGMMPIFWGMYKGDEYVGVTIHYINKDLDKGDIIRQEKVRVGDDSLHELILKTKRISAGLVDETLRDIMKGTVKSSLMPEGGSYQTFPTSDEVMEFRRRGRRIF